MDCKLDGDLIQEYLDGTLSQIEKMILEEHIKNCESCKMEFNSMKALFNEFDSLDEDTDVPDGLPFLRNQVLSTIAEPDFKGRFGIREFLKVQEAAFKGAGIFTEFVPGMASGAKYIKKSVKKTPHILYKTLSFAFKGSMKLMAVRGKA